MAAKCDAGRAYWRSWGRGTITARPKYGLKRTRGCRILFLIFSYFQDSILRTTCSAIQLSHKRCKNQGSRQAMPHYAYLKLKMPGPRGVITVNGNTECSLRTEEHTAALAVEVQSSLLRQFSSPAVKKPDTAKRARSNLQQDRLARSEQA